MVKDMFFFCALDRVGNQINLIDGRVGVKVVESGATVERATTPQGFVQDFEAGGSAARAGFVFGNTGGSGVYEPSAEITMLSRVRPEGEYDSGWSRIVSKRTTVGGDDDYALIFKSNTEMYTRVGSNDGAVLSFGSSHDGQLIEIAGVITGSGDLSSYAWNLDTGSIDNTNNAARSLGTGTGNLCIGHRDNEAREWDGHIHYVALWNKAKSLDFLNAFRANPWQVFAPQRIFVPMTDAAIVIPPAEEPPVVSEFPYHVIKQRRRGMKTLLTM